MYHFQDSDAEGEWHAVFRAMDQHGNLHRDHLPRPMVAINGYWDMDAGKRGATVMGSQIDARDYYVAQGWKVLDGFDPAQHSPFCGGIPDVVLYKDDGRSVQLLFVDNKMSGTAGNIGKDAILGFSDPATYESWKDAVLAQYHNLPWGFRDRVEAAVVNDRIYKVVTNAFGATTGLTTEAAKCAYFEDLTSGERARWTFGPEGEAALEEGFRAYEALLQNGLRKARNRAIRQGAFKCCKRLGKAFTAVNIAYYAVLVEEYGLDFALDRAARDAVMLDETVDAVTFIGNLAEQKLSSWALNLGTIKMIIQLEQEDQ
jgi:hypothetical protein